MGPNTASTYSPTELLCFARERIREVFVLSSGDSGRNRILEEAASQAVKGFPLLVGSLLEETDDPLANTILAVAYINSALNGRVYPIEPDSFMTDFGNWAGPGSDFVEENLKLGILLLAKEVVSRAAQTENFHSLLSAFPQ